MEVCLKNCSQNGGNLYRAPYYNRNQNIGPRIHSNLGQSPDGAPAPKLSTLKRSWKLQAATEAMRSLLRV